MSIRVLVVDDSATIRHTVNKLLTGEGMQVVLARNGLEAINLLRTDDGFDVVVSDLRMPGVDGHTLVSTLQHAEEFVSLPVVILTSSTEQDDHVRNLEAGASAYITKPWDDAVLLATVRRLAKQRNRSVALERDSRTDVLTGLFNRRYGEQRLKQELETFGRHGRAFTVALVDIDHFKRINDTLGHSAGDEVLRRVAAELRRASRASDLVIRWGGEEFLFVFPETALVQAGAIVERFRTQLAAHPVEVAAGEGPVPVTISGGLSEIAAGDTLEELVARADKGLYAAKGSGRNRLLQFERGQFVPVAAA